MDIKEQKTTLITGSGGFIGHNLKEYLTDYNLLSPRSYELNLVHTKEVEEYFRQNKNIDYIIHCGSIGGYRTVTDKDTTIEDNLNMVKNLLKYKKETTRLILFGSGAMYDKSRDLHKVRESEIGNYEPADLYGKSKLMIAQKIKDRKDVLLLNIFGCYGKYEKDSRFPTYAIKRNLSKQPIEINKNVVFDYLYIDDLCKIVKHFIENETSENIINVTPTESISLLEIAKIVNENGDFKSEIKINEAGLNKEYTGNNERLLSEFCNFKFTEYKNGLKILFEYIKAISEGGGKFRLKALSVGFDEMLQRIFGEKAILAFSFLRAEMRGYE